MNHVQGKLKLEGTGCVCLQVARQTSQVSGLFLTLCFVYIFSIRWSKYLPPETLFGFNQ